MGYNWQENKRQKAWLWVGLLFFVFYFTEALLFWGPQPRLVPPPFAPLVFWGLFGAVLIWIITRPIPNVARATRSERLKSVVLGLTITAASVGSAFLIIWRTGDLTLGHAVLLFVLAQAGLIIGALSFNAGWFVAGLLWIGGAACVLCQPTVQDYAIGAAVAGGFVLIGSCRKCLVPAEVGV
jgi:hypothetical protein